MQEQIDRLQKQIDEIKQGNINQIGVQNDYVNIKNINDFIEVVSVIPTHTPQNFYEQIKIYINGATYRIYVYNNIQNSWRYAILT